MAKARSRKQDRARTSDESAAPKPGRRAKTTWKLMDRSTTMAAAVVAPLVAGGAWRLVTGKRPPTTAENPELDAREAVMWALVGGALVEGVKLVIRRKTAEYWVSSTGHLPPGMKSLVTEPANESDLAEPGAPVSPQKRRR